MSSRHILSLSALAALTALLATPAVNARAIRFDAGDAVGAVDPSDPTNPDLKSWNPQTGDVNIGDFLDIGFNFNYLGGTATRVQVGAFGTLDLLDSTGSLVGSITVFDHLADTAQFGRAAGPIDPLPALDGDPITDGFRVLWHSNDLGLDAQVVLFNLGSGGSLIELNYLAGTDGLDLSETAPSIGLLSTAGGTAAFNLLDQITANQAGCLATFGRNHGFPPDEAPSDGCTGFIDNGTFSAGLPTLFQTANGGAVGSSDPIADYRWLLRFPGTGTPPPPTQVPEPSSVVLLLAGALTALWRRRLGRG